MTKSERTRQFIIERSAALFNRKGYAGTSLNDIIEVTGLSKGGIYGNFKKGKEEIAVAAFRRDCGQVGNKGQMRGRRRHGSRMLEVRRFRAVASNIGGSLK